MAFGVTFAGSMLLYVAVLLLGFTMLLGVAGHARDASVDRTISSVPSASGTPGPLDRLQALVSEHPREVGVLLAIDGATSTALHDNPQDANALGTALGEVAQEQGADDAQAAQVSQAVRTRYPEIRALSAIDAATLQELQASPGDTSAQSRAVGQIMTGVGVDQQEAVRLLVGLADPGVQQDLRLFQQYAQLVQQASTAVSASDQAFLRTHAGEARAILNRTPH